MGFIIEGICLESMLWLDNIFDLRKYSFKPLAAKPTFDDAWQV
jgi:hypothetical protein